MKNHFKISPHPSVSSGGNLSRRRSAVRRALLATLFVLLAPSETAIDKNTWSNEPGQTQDQWIGGDYMWTIRPDQYRNRP